MVRWVIQWAGLTAVALLTACAQLPVYTTLPVDVLVTFTE